MSTQKTSTYPAVVAVDTQILIFALRDKYKDDQQRQVSVRAKRLFQEIIEAKSKILLSIISVGEYLVGIPEAQQPAVGQELMEQYLIAPYNLRAAILAARLVPFASTGRAKPLRPPRASRRLRLHGTR